MLSSVTMTTDMTSTMALEKEAILSTLFANSSSENSNGLRASNIVEKTATAAMMETTAQGDGRNFRFEDYGQRATIGTIVCLVAVVGFAGNFMVILAVILSKKLQTRTNAFVVNLAVADLATSFITPLSAVALFSMDGWPLPNAMCSVLAAIGFACLGSSVMNLAAIAINRFVLITKSMTTYWSIYTPKKIAAMLVFTWVYPALLCCLPLAGLGKWGYSEKYKTCSQDTSDDSSDIFSVVGSALVFPVPLIILFVCYFKIYRHVTGHIKKLTGKGVEMTDTPGPSAASTSELHQKPPASFSKRQVKITKNLFYVVCAFVACLAPFAIALMIPPSDPVVPWTAMITTFNSCINPIIYGAKHPHFKEVFRHIAVPLPHDPGTF